MKYKQTTETFIPRVMKSKQTNNFLTITLTKIQETDIMRWEQR